MKPYIIKTVDIANNKSQIVLVWAKTPESACNKAKKLSLYKTVSKVVQSSL